jgi:hypothetical protein
MELLHPVRVARTYTQTLIAPPEVVFPLLCPVREVEWASGWNPRQVISHSGVIEKDCIFVMPGQPTDSVWVVTEWNPEEYLVKFVKVTPGYTVGMIELRLRAGGPDQTLADISYGYTALSPEGVKFVERFTTEYYEAFMKEWEGELNHFLQTGTKKVLTGV